MCLMLISNIQYERMNKTFENAMVPALTDKKCSRKLKRDDDRKKTFVRTFAFTHRGISKEKETIFDMPLLLCVKYVEPEFSLSLSQSHT